MKQYAFGDSDLAAQRLELLAELFAEPTKAFIVQSQLEFQSQSGKDAGFSSSSSKPSLALDLGCGPGHTTRLLAELLQCEFTVGIDCSEHFIELAKRFESPKISFLLHDVTQLPFPSGRPDLIYCRYLLSHLEDPQALVLKWVDQLTPGGLLLVEENERIETTNPAFRFYLEVVEDMLASRGARLYVGPVIDRVPETDRLKRQSSRIRPHRLPTHRAAAMFYMNIQTWKRDPFVTENYSTETMDGLEHDLQRLASRTGDAIEIEWGLRQVAFEKM
jgi:SAM-dependent methyltransferase